MTSDDVIRVDLTRKDDSLMLYPQDTLLANTLVDWGGLHFQYHRQPPHEMVHHACSQHRIIIHDRTLSLPMIATIGELTQLTQINRGTITIVPAQARNYAYWTDEHQFIVLAFEANDLEQDIAEAKNSSDVDLLPTLGNSDPLISSIGLALKTELESPERGHRLYVDAMKTALFAHLLRHYSTRNLILPAAPTCLPKAKLQQVVDYIQAHLEQDLTLAQLASVVHMSPNYFSNVFKHSIGLAPYQYVIQCRVERAKQLLLQNKLTIAEIALTLGFAHQSHFSRHFKRLVGVTPKAFLKSQ